ncbi:peptidoglycan-binding protein [Aliigemmobacter aestuarii]|uniref:Peptidoglycan-binding protein n=1 Tax=Aliigemmobacter aestuarii TaxID=1445661 RepID=A0A4V3V058_9RHOB|nr:peptidoglycan-binding domain-containing protein [Gemmobacter aestuarii]THD82288.1 peptidoglycan-binding protein [Gemmobacter aestuarii]
MRVKHRVKHVVATALFGSVLALPAEPALAWKVNGPAGGIGGMHGPILVQETAPAQRAKNREVQTALKFFKYPVGPADGEMGPKTRDAIRRFQRTLGYPQTGNISDHERKILIAAYHRARAGGPVVAEIIATHPRGLRGLLFVQRDEMAGLAKPPAGAVAGAGAAAAVPQAPAPVEPPAEPPAPAVAAAPAPAPEPAPEPAAPALPSLFGSSGLTVSLASHCAQVEAEAEAAGGRVTTGTMTDPNRALAEQFCLTRAHVMAEGEAQARNVPGFTPQQIAEQCAAFGPVMKDHVAALSLASASEVLDGVDNFVLQSGMAPAQLSATARICLGVGYGSDDMEVAVGSALILSSLGELAYAELLGHHLSQGFGASRRADLALEWYELGGAPGLVPGMPERDELVLQAALAINGLFDPAPAALPVFPVPEEPLAEEPLAQEPPAEEPIVEAPADPAAETPAPEDPGPEDPAPEDPAPEDPAPEAAVTDIPEAEPAAEPAAEPTAEPAAEPAAEPLPEAVATIAPEAPPAQPDPDEGRSTGALSAVSAVARLPYVIFGD